MAVTRAGFAGQTPEERQQHFNPDDLYGANQSAESLLLGMVGAEAMNSPAAKGLPGSGSKPTGPIASDESGPRRAGTSQPVPAGNPESTGTAGPLPKSASGVVGSLNTGAGGGRKIIVTYGPGAQVGR